MTYEQWQNLFGGLYALLGLILTAICFTLIYFVLNNINETNKDKEIKKLKKENDDLRQKINNIIETQKMKDEYERLMKIYRREK